MSRYLAFILLMLSLGIAAFAAPATVVVNGKTVSVPVVEANGKAYVDIVTLMKLLGGMATYNAATHKIVINTPGTGGGAAGTAQLAGDNGELGKLYTLRKSTPLYFCLKSVEFTTSQVNIGDKIYVPKADEKLMLLRFTIQNPNKTDTFVRGDGLRIMAVDMMNVNHECRSIWGDAESLQYIARDLKPAQKIEAYTVIVVAAKGSIPKLMVQPWNDNDGPLLRYDLRDKVTPLKAPIADPADPTGSTALPVVKGEFNVAYPYKNFDITVEKFDYATVGLDDEPAPKDMRFLVATLLIKNKAPNPSFLRGDYITPELTSTDGEALRYRCMLFASSNRRIQQDLKPGQEMRVRILMDIPKGCVPQTLSLHEGDSRAYEFSVK